MPTFTPVTKDEFYGRIFREKLNVHPHPQRDVTYWEFPDRSLFGKSTPGWMATGSRTYFLADR